MEEDVLCLDAPPGCHHPPWFPAVMAGPNPAATEFTSYVVEIASVVSVLKPDRNRVHIVPLAGFLQPPLSRMTQSDLQILLT